MADVSNLFVREPLLLILREGALAVRRPGGSQAGWAVLTECPISHHNTWNWRKTKSNGETKLASRNSSLLPHLLVLPLEATVLIF